MSEGPSESESESESESIPKPTGARAPVLVIENDPSDPIGRLGQWLSTAGVNLQVRRPYARPADDGLDPAALAGYSGLIVMGGEQGAYDDELAPWLPRLRALLREAVRIELPTLGICLGGQLLAVSAGGRVQPAAEPEYGAQLIAKRQAAVSDPLFGALPITPDVLQWHVDEITQLPPGALLLASSPVCEVQLFRVGRLAWGTQFHVETDPATVRRWAEADEAELDGYDLPRLLARAEMMHPQIAETWRPIAETFVGILDDPQRLAGPRSLPLAGRGPEHTAGPITDPAAIRAALAAEMQAARGPHGH